MSFISSFARSIHTFESGVGTYNLPTSVNVATTVIFYGGCRSSSASGFADGEGLGRCYLANSTQVVITNDGTAYNTASVRGTVVELVSTFVKSVQYCAIPVSNGATYGDLGITTVDVNKSIPMFLGCTVNWSGTLNGSGILIRDLGFVVELVASNVVRASRNGNQKPAYAGCCLLELR
jgi:hypothetical protein